MMWLTRSSTAMVPGVHLLMATTTLMLLLLPPVLVHSMSSSSDRKTYLVHVREDLIIRSPTERHSWHLSLISQATGITSSSDLEQRLLYSYTEVMRGFAVSLTSSEAAAMAALEDIVAFSENSVSELHTTRTPSFMELSNSVNNDVSGKLWAASKRGDGVVIGVIDTGAWPNNPSFSDAGLSPIPGWTGICQSSFPCNNKIIGARYFAIGHTIDKSLDFDSPLDAEGHGTHTASTAAGSLVSNASIFGLANGTASGIAPLARLSIYKACWRPGCYDADVLAAFEAAIKDGVHVISVSIGNADDYSTSGIFKGAFAAVAKGITVVASAGNDGPDAGTVANGAPWILTVAASSLDRDFPAPVTLGDGTEYVGTSLYVGSEIQGGLIYAGKAAKAGRDATNASNCVSADDLNVTAVTGKVVLCDGYNVFGVQKSVAVKGAGGVGTIVANAVSRGETMESEAHIAPAANVGNIAGSAIKNYINGSASPSAKIAFRGTRLGTKAPIMAAFSSRGPRFTPLTAIPILKPDITAPGLNVLAAWTGATSPSELPQDTRRVLFNIISGTSMSCPHVSGLAALLKAAHPTWSPAAIKSALITTATTLDNTGSFILDGASSTSAKANAFAYGSGHVKPNLALDPGLIYDLGPQDYVDYLCGLDPSLALVTLYTNKTSCSSPVPKLGDMNYPSFRVAFTQSIQTSAASYNITFSRRVTNVGPAVSTYTASLNPLPPVSVSVAPPVLVFASQNQTLSYSITFAVPRLSSLRFDANGISYDFVLGDLSWSDGSGGHVVRSPISVVWY